MIDSAKYQAQASELSQKLWAIANDLRGNMDSTKFRNYILGTIFYRYLSERTEDYMQEILKEDGLTYEQAFANDDYRPVVEQWSIEHLGYIIRPENLFDELVRRIVRPDGDADRFNVEDYERAVNELTGSTMGQASEAAFSGLFNDMKLQDPDLGDTVAARTSLIAKVIVKISEIDFKLADSQFDVLGTAYMILIGLFASDAGKKSGEFFTPTGPSKLVATLATVGLDEARTVGDCTCGSASMLLEVQKHLTTGRVGHFYGQENNATTYNLARMNMLMHGVDYQHFDIYKGDTLREDKYGDVKMTVQVCNPPYSLKYDGNPALLDDPRYSGAGKLPPKSHADYAFVEHMVYHMDDNDGRVAVLLPHGVLFRGGAEEVIRKYIVKDLNRLDAVIGLAPNLFHGTSIPVCLLVLKSKRNGNSGNVLFIDASKEFKPGKNQNTLEDAHIQKIVEAYENRVDVDKFAHVADMAEIEANGWNLNIPRYVDTFEEEEPVDLAAVRDDLKRIESEKKAAIDKVESMLHQLRLCERVGDTKTSMLRFKADDGSEFPAWEEKTLGEITGLFVGKSFTSELNKNGCYVVMDMGSVSPDGSIIDAKLTDLGRDILRRGDLIMPKDDIGGGLIIGKTAYIPCDDKYVCGDHVYRLRFDGEIDGLFMHYEINSSGPQRRLGRKVTGSAQLGLNSKSVSSETVSVPSISEQRKIADCLSSIDEAIQKSKDELAKWQELKKGLLQQMFV